MKVRIVLLAVLVLVFGLASAIQAQPNLEDFETGDFSSLPWSVSYWRVTSEEAYSGSYSVAAYSTSTGVLEVTLTTGAGQISFWRYSDDNGWLKFYIDGVLTDNWSSLSSTWIQESFPVSAGTHTLRWEASSSGNDDNDVYIDDITFPQTGAEPSAGMALIPAGSFQMGDSFNEGDSDELPVHTVTVSAFYMDKYEVTKALWDEVAEWAAANGYDIGPEDGSTDRSDGSGKADEHPVTYVSWYEAVKWANARSEKEGLTPCYTVDGNVYRTGRSAPDCNWGANGYRLPTEAEWEKAARGGLDGRRYPWGNEDPVCEAGARNGARFDDNNRCDDIGTAPVGTYSPNGYGLYDTAGNVWEWCWDWYNSGYYSSSPGSDPRGPASGASRVERGGGWSGSAYYCRVANRYGVSPGYGNNALGFRLVRRAP